MKKVIMAVLIMCAFVVTGCTTDDKMMKDDKMMDDGMKKDKMMKDDMKKDKMMKDGM